MRTEGTRSHIQSENEKDYQSKEFYIQQNHPPQSKKKLRHTQINKD